MEPTRADNAHGALSFLIWGDQASAMAMLAAALARRSAPRFAWANCSSPPDALEEVVRGHLRRLGEGEPIEEVNAHLLTSPVVHRTSLDQLIRPDETPPVTERRLLAYVALPELLQLLTARAVSAEGPEPIILTNIDALPWGFLDRAFLAPETHQSLREAGVALLATYRGPVSDTLRRAFDVVYRVQAQPGLPWPEALVSFEVGRPPADPFEPVTLRQFWDVRGFAPDLLPPP